MRNRKRFEVIYKEGSEFSNLIQILVDRQTGVNYMVCKSGYGSGITPLLDASGKVVISEKSRFDSFDSFD